MKSAEVRRHSETPGNFIAPAIQSILWGGNCKNREETETKRPSQRCPLKETLSLRKEMCALKTDKTSHSCENIGTLEVLLEDPKEHGEVQENLNSPQNNHIHTNGAWKLLEEEIGDVNLLIQTYSEKGSVREKVN